ncbi:transcriptional activator NhaR [Enterovibrio norvegicus]|uniref:Transcriptional activator protein NhaR n=2 Tax=Enterovibrio norvegicus TaxID=188144 RepID=A0A2N7LAT6_9GAMM|nr:transcriptional activator NhaR [Enterovibrio norvegicus]MCC4799699.1 transcriptional activator NhaR [Enterovibrio norvegicus]OEE43087.1 transcriptional activator NhaR [Enterovibrio norvegicus]OEF54833.1 transcriptional activator NhaR [Enterovibrio norvegicus]OEF59194.1 transcriptional activator NhaR [Enterovibrio norvegicus]PMH71093.1 transcriptional activator NhaR [Enterovibrio norvegicus]
MSHLNYNHLYYFWMVCKQGSVTKAAEALFLTPQTVTGQIRALEERLKGRLTKRVGRNIEPTELGQLVYKYADKMFGLSYEMLDIVNYSQQENVLFDVGVADALSKSLVSRVLLKAVPEDNSIHLRCFESTHELLLEQLSQHKLDMILSDCPVDSTQSPGLFSVKLGESVMSFFCSDSLIDASFPAVIEEYKLLIPGTRTAMGRKLMHWFDSQGITPNILGEFDDAALMKAFGSNHRAMFVAPTFYSEDVLELPNVQEVAKVKELKEEYYVIFAERMIQHPAVKRICEADFSKLFH